MVNLADHALEVYREPVMAAGAPYGWRYASLTALRAGDVVTPLATPHTSIPVVDLIP